MCRSTRVAEMKNMLAALFAACLAMSIAAVTIVVASDTGEAPKTISVIRDTSGDAIIDAAIARQLAAAKARVVAMREREAVALRGKPRRAVIRGFSL